MNDLIEILEPLAVCVAGILIAAWRAIPIFLVVLAIDSVLNRKIPARVHAVLWTLVFCRLLLPFSITSPLSPTNLSDHLANRIDQWIYSEPAKPAPEFEVATWKLRNGEYVSEPILQPGAPPELRARAEAYAASVHERKVAEIENPTWPNPTMSEWASWEEALAIGLLAVWPCVVIGLGLRQWFAYRNFLLIVRRSPKLEIAEYTEKLATICHEYGIARIPSIQIVEQLSVPAMFGILRPTLCLPSTTISELTPRELEWVLRHELAHVKRKDAIVLSVATMIRTLHWFHPIAWLAMNRLKLRIEQAADDRATKHLQKSDVIDYGHLLLRYASSSNRQGFAITGCLSMASHRNLRSRLERLGNDSAKLSMRAKIASASLLLLVSLFGLTDARIQENDASSNSDYQNNSRQELALLASFVPKAENPILEAIHQQEIFLLKGTSEQDEIVQEFQFDVTEVIEKALRIEPDIDTEKFIESFVMNDKIAQVKDGVLWANLTESQARFTQGFIDSFLKYGQGQITEEIRFIEADVSFGYDWKWNLVSLDTEASTKNQAVAVGTQFAVTMNQPSNTKAETYRHEKMNPSLVAKISDRELGVFLHRVQSAKGQGGAILQAPKVTHFFGQQVSVSDAAKRPFVTNLHVIEGAESYACQPLIDVLDDGVAIQLFSFPTSNDMIELSCAVLESTIESVEHAVLPFNPREFNTGDKDLVEIHVPKVHRKHMGSKVCLAKDESLVICSPQGYLPGRSKPVTKAKFYVITPTIVVSDTDSLKEFAKKK